MMATANVAVVLIGRNEGARLVACLASIRGQAGRMVYVDSGSTDDSLAAALAVGAEVVMLDPSLPFTAARARNAGFDALRQGPLPDWVQFVDGDCEVEEGWILTAREAMAKDDRLAIVTGWRAEIHPEHSLYNAMCDVEWHRPAGPITVCGGDMMVRWEAFEQIGGFDGSVIAAEDDEFCLRIGQAGWKLHRLPLQMTRHDVNMTRFSQWWKRAVRAGHGFAQVEAMHPGHFRRAYRRVVFWGALLPVAALISGIWAPQFLAIILLAYALSYLRTAENLHRMDGLPWKAAFAQAVLLILSKFPNMQGMLTYYWRRLRQRDMQIIEYK